MDRSTLNKVQKQFWVTKQTVYRKLGKKEDDCIVASDATLDAKLELFKSIQITSSAMNKLLDRYQEKICFLAQEQNAMGRFLKEYGKTDKSGAGKMMIQMGKSLIYCSQQEIALRPPLLRLYQEVETFRNRAVEDTLETINSMERNRTEYRASLNWMKNVSQELDPDTYKQMEKFRKVQTHVKKSKAQFDKLKLACLQKVDLLAAARCCQLSHALIQYQNSIIRTTGKNAKVYNTLATTFKGYQHFEFSVVKELAEPSKKLATETGTQKPTEELLFDFGDTLAEDSNSKDANRKPKDTKNDTENDLIGAATGATCRKSQEGEAQLIGLDLDGGGGGSGDATNIANNGSDVTNASVDDILDSQMIRKRLNEEDLLASETASELLENLLGSGTDQSPETELANDALDLGLGLFSPNSASTASTEPKEGSSNSSSRLSIGSLSLLSKSSSKDQKNKEKEKEVADLLADFEASLPVDTNNDTMALLNEILNVSSSQAFTSLSSSQQQPLLPFTYENDKNKGDMSLASGSLNPSSSAAPSSSSTFNSSSFLPSQLLDLSSLDDSGDLLNFNGPPITNANNKKDEASGGISSSNSSASASAMSKWFDLFSDLDPIQNDGV